jgi:hypothetical protein
MRVAGGALERLVDIQGYGRHGDDSAHQPIDALKLRIASELSHRSLFLNFLIV